MPDTFAVTILFIVACTVIGAFVKGRVKDRCLKDFCGCHVNLEKKGGKAVWGKLRVENACLEFLYDEAYLDPTDKHLEKSYILYKNEYDGVLAFVRYIDDLDPAQAKGRKKSLERTSNPGWCLILLRKSRNVAGTIRDSLMEVVNLLMGRMKGATPAGKLLEGQDKYVSQMQQEGISAIGMSYEPILERYIGKKVVLAMTRGDKKEEYSGILKDYTAGFVEVLDVEYKRLADQAARKADIVVPRGVGTVRHAGE